MPEEPLGKENLFVERANIYNFGIEDLKNIEHNSIEELRCLHGCLTWLSGTIQGAWREQLARACNRWSFACWAWSGSVD